MKTKMHIAIIALMASLLAPIISGMAQGSYQHLTGRAIKNNEAVKSADSVIVGRIMELGEDDVGAPGQVYYGDVKIEVLQTLKGRAPKTITMSLTVQKFPVAEAEEPPAIDQKYVVFIKHLSSTQRKGVKLLNATDENINAITIGIQKAAKQKQIRRVSPN